ncbi:TonB-dependent receptor [Brevundimonas sp.]|uniref:TonB-dependent receptor n=1 Tax=Brevundimonas sp. TaxID=1871086 RepID=UPI002FC7A4B4
MLIDLPQPPQTPASEITRVQDIIVTAARLRPQLAQIAFDHTTLHSEDLTATARVDQALRQIPAVTLFRRADSLAANPTTQGLSLRAIAPTGAGRALVTLDGVPINDPFGGWVIWGQVTPESLEAIDVMRGAGSGPYGAGALTGTIALRESDRPQGIADLSVASRGGLRAAASTRVEQGRFGLTLAGSHESSDGYVPVRGSVAGLADVPMDLKLESLSGRLDYAVGSETSLSLRAASWQEDRGSGLGRNRANASGNSVTATLSRQATQGPAWRIQLWENHSNLFNSSGAVSADRSTVTPANEQYRTPARGRGINLALRNTLSLHGMLEWEAGLDARFNEGQTQEMFRYMGGAFTRGRMAGGETSVIGGYVDASWHNGPWIVAGGLRLDEWQNENGFRFENDLQSGAITLNETDPERSDQVVSARLGVRRALGPDSWLRASAYSGFRPATLNELHRPFRVGNDLTEANAGLVPETLEGFELEWGHSSDRHSISATVFRNMIDDVVVNVTLAEGPGSFPRAGFVPAGGVLRQRQNAGSVTATGVEVSGRYDATSTLGLKAALAWTDAEMDGGQLAPQLTGLRPAQAPEWSANIGADWQVTPTLLAQANARYESARFDDDLNSRPLKAAWTIDARAQWQVLPHAALWLAADNLLDEDIETSLTGTGIAGYTAPRTLRAGVRLTY